VILAVLSAAPYAGVLAYACTRDTHLAPLTGAIGGIGGVLLLFALLRRVDDAMPWALVLLGGAMPSRSSCAATGSTRAHRSWPPA
jgi:hypothetical protein